MKMLQKLVSQSANYRGATVVIVAIVLAVLVGFTALAVDIGYLLATRNELQNVADAAALAGARALGRLYECNGDIDTCSGAMHYEDQLTYNLADNNDDGTIKDAITDVASNNIAGGKSGIIIKDSDIVIGTWDTASKTVSPNLISPDAVKIIARRDSIANDPITTFFARILGINTADVSAIAVAALTGESTATDGGLPLPLALNKSWLTILPCNQNLQLHPSSGDVCSAWHVYDGVDYSPNAEDLKDLINSITNGSYSSPGTDIGDEFDVTNGTVAKIFTSNAIQNLFDTMKVLNDGIMDMDEDSTTWTTGVPVFDDSVVGCAPVGSLEVVGFTTICITAVIGPPDNTVYGKVMCDNVVEGRGSGGEYGTKGSIPGLVQ